MKETLRKLLKICFALAAASLFVLLILGLVLVFGWPWWVGVFLALLLTGIVLGGVFLRKIYTRRREQNFVDEMSEQDQAAMQAMSDKEKSQYRDLNDNWKSAIDTLRNSHLRKLGNPLYVLPWYMVIGESGSGKTTSLNNAHLSSPLRDVNRIQGVSGTKQCDWWFFEKSVVIDTAGRYAIPAHQENDREEWRKFLSLLIKYRRKEPLNGLIVTVAADRLLEGAKDQLVNDGHTIRQRIDELMRALGVSFPVYILVTKCDLIQGVNRFCQLLPEKALNQPMGYINQDMATDVEAFVNHALETINERLRNLRLQLLHQPEAQNNDPALLLFPEEFESLKQGLEAFTGTAFRKNPYQETPLLRGIFFSSGRQAGNPYSQFSKNLGMPGVDEALPDTSKGLFLHDFFDKILPLDRSLLKPTQRYIEWKALTNNLGLASWVILGIAVCGLLSFSFFKNMKTIRDFSRATYQSAVFSGNLPADLSVLERFRQEILKVEEQNRHWWFPRFGLNESLKIEERLKERFCARFQTSILTPFDRQLATGVTGISASTPDDIHAQYVIHLMRRINILKTRLNDNDLKKLQSKPQPSYVCGLNSPFQWLGTDAKNEFGSLYLSYLIWKTDTKDINREIGTLQSWLRQLIAVKGSNMQWLATWIDKRSGITAITLKDFWGGSVATANEKCVTPSFTRKGKESVDALFAELEAALQDSSSVTGYKASFYCWYRNAAFESWRAFAANFSRGAEMPRGPSEAQQMAARMASDKNPYFELFDRITLELEPLLTTASSPSPLPSWLQQIFRLQSIRMQRFAQNRGAVTKAAESGAKVITILRKNLGKEASAHVLEPEVATMKAWQDYQNSLIAIAPATASKNQAFQLCSQTFSEDQVTGKSPVYTAYNAFGKIKNGIGGGSSDPVFSQLLGGPFNYLWAYLLKEGGSQLQAQWEEQVLAATSGMPESQAIPITFGPEGLAWRFVKGPAAPFLTGNVSGFHAKTVLGGKIAFDMNLLHFMNNKGAKIRAEVEKSSKPQNFNVGIRGLPTDANNDAKFKPHTTRLELQCGATTQTLVNNNYPAGKTFSWSPDSCSDAILQIEVGDKVLSRHYMGQDGFPSFLKDMRGGRRTFSVRDFPGEKSALEAMGIKYITINYQFSGSKAILQHTATLSGHAPMRIAR